MKQNLKKETCTGECHPQCPIYNILQRRIGNQVITNTTTIENMARQIQDERCPDNTQLNTHHLNPANTQYRSCC
jgi:hypothetical protein